MPAKTPFPYQLEGAEFLAGRERALLADEMGIGKTGQAIVAVGLHGFDRVLVICPASLVRNWRREFEAFLDRLPTTLEIISYDKARTDKEFKRLCSQNRDCVILDEAHYCKTHDSQRTIAALTLGQQARHFWALTGTPMPNNPAELYPIIRELDPGAILNPKTGRPMSRSDFTDRYCRVKWERIRRRDKHGNLVVKDVEKIKGGKNLDDLARKMSRFMLRRTKEQVLDLPPLFVNNLMIDAAIPRDLKELEAELGPAVVKALRRYEAGDDTALSAIQTHVARLRRLIGSIKAPEVARVISDRLEGNEGQPVICFAWHSEVVESIRDRLRASGYRVATIVGADSQPARQRAVDDFQAGKLDCIIGNIRAAGVGITLTASRYEIFAESSWVPADNAQAMMRAHRIGQKHAVNVDFATLARSIDETIEAANMRKARDFSRIFKEKEA